MHDMPWAVNQSPTGFHRVHGDIPEGQESWSTSLMRGSSLNTYFGEIKQCKCMVIFRDFLYNSALFGLGI